MQTNIDEAVTKEAFIDPEKKDDWQEVQNYVQAMNNAVSELDKMPLSNRLLKNAHKILLEGVRGMHKQPGQFRLSQNWIGGHNITNAIFVPPHPDGVPDYMADLEKFIHNSDTNLPHLIKIGILHYHFETIHPFLDGNGRIGRLLISLYLVSTGLLVKPTLYLSDFLEKNKSAYYDRLTDVRTNNNLEQWLIFFLEGVKATSDNSIETFKKIISLRSKLDAQLITLGVRQVLANEVIQFLYSQPITDMQSIAEATKASVPTISRLINDLVKMEILIEQTGFRRNRIFAFEQYLRLFR